MNTSLVLLASMLLAGSKSETIWNTVEWTHDHIEWQFHAGPQGFRKTFLTKKGDCTDRAMLAQELLRMNKIKSRVVRGWVKENENSSWFKHDWLEAQDEHGQWISYEQSYVFALQKSGAGPW